MKKLYGAETTRQIELLERNRLSEINSIIIEHVVVNGKIDQDSAIQVANKINKEIRIKTIDAILQKIYETAIPIGFEEDEKTT
jgi:hypothetical protein